MARGQDDDPVDSLVAGLDPIWCGFAVMVTGRSPTDRRRLLHHAAARLDRLEHLRGREEGHR